MTTLVRLVRQVPFFFLLTTQVALASVNPNSTPTTGVKAASASGAAALAAPGEDCSRVCDGLRNKLKSNSRSIDAEYQMWQMRLGVKTDVIRYPQGFSAAEELLHFMSTYYVTKAPANQMDAAFLTFLMGKCFPETYIDTDRARLSGLVDTIWLAENVRLTKAQNELSTCR